MSWIRRTTAGRGGMCLTLTATSAVVIGLAWAAAPATSPAVKLAAAAKPAGNTAPGTASPGRTAGFVLDHGRYLPVAPPRGLGDLVSSPLGPVGINDSGQVTGSYLDPAGRERGFLLDRNRNKFVQVDVPGAVGTQGQGINNQGQVVGAYSDTGSTGVNGAQLRGFLLDHGRYIRLDYPGAVSSQADDINDRGQVVGEYQAADGTFHGYLWERGRFRTLPTPGGATGINNRGQITGVAGDVTTTDGYLLDGNRLTTFGAPGAQITIPYDINDRGQIVGGSLTSLADTAPSGFLRSGGRFIVINRPGAVATVLFGINDRGQIAGVGPTAEDLASLPGAAMMP
jgi:probable HAF family extracellular repeat protein